MTSRSWEKYLFKEHKAVAVSPLKGTRSIQLLDVLVKRPRLFPPASHSVDVVDIGPWYELGLCAEEDEDALTVMKDLEKDLKDHLPKLFKDPDEDDEEDDEDESPLITSEYLTSIQETVKVGSKVMGDLMNFVSLGRTSSKVVTCRLDNVILHQVKRDRLKEVWKIWKPDFKQINLHGKPQSTLSGRLDLWVVTDILVADKVHINTGKTRSINVGGQVGVDLGILNPILGIPPAVDGEFTHEHSDDARKVYSGKNLLFAIRAMLLRYNSEGKLIHFDVTGGESMYNVRHVLTSEYFNPVGQPIYNMGGLFENIPDNEEEDLNPLHIVVEGAAAADTYPQPQRDEASDFNNSI